MSGVHFRGDFAETETVVMRAKTGTVRRIKTSFRNIGSKGTANLATVAPGIAEALIATAMGLAVAIPVVIAYNALSRTVQDKLSQAEEVCTLIRAIRLNK